MKKTAQKPKVEASRSGVCSCYPEINENRLGGKKVVTPVLYSLIGHAAVFIALIFLPHLSFERTYKPSVIDVRMVSPGDLGLDSRSDKTAGQKDGADLLERATEKTPENGKTGPAAKTDSGIETKPAEDQEKPPDEKKPVISPKIEKVKPDVSLAPKDVKKEKPAEKKIEVKKSLKKETFKPSEVVKSAVEQWKEEDEDSGTESVSEAIARFRKNLEKESGSKSPHKNVSNQDGAGSGQRGGWRAGTGGLGSGEIMEVYKTVVAYHIQGNWAFSEQLSKGGSDLETLVGIKVMPNGEIQDIWFDKKSGNSYLDESAMRAIKKSNPLPPLPGDTGRYYMIGLRFTPKGLDG